MNLNIPTYHDFLNEARDWRATESEEALAKANEVLERGLTEHPYALPLADELVLVLEKFKGDKVSRQRLEKIAELFKDPGEETLARFGKMYKRLGLQQIEQKHYAAANPNLEESERQYGLAFDKANGFYPRINQLTVRFVRAGVLKALDKTVEAQELVQSVREDVRRMLADPALWLARNPDDDIWIPATQGEANVLLENWNDAEIGYAEAIRQASGKKFYQDCMRDQIKEFLRPAFDRLGLKFQGKLSDPDVFFLLDEENPK